MRRRRQPCNDSNLLSTSNVVGSLVTGRGQPKLAGAALRAVSRLAVQERCGQHGSGDGQYGGHC